MEKSRFRSEGVGEKANLNQVSEVLKSLYNIEEDLDGNLTLQKLPSKEMNSDNQHGCSQSKILLNDSNKTIEKSESVTRKL